MQRKISISESLADGQISPRRDYPTPQIGSLTPQLLQKCSNYQFQYLNLAQILSKTYSIRNHNEIRFISQFVKKNTAFKQLMELVGQEFCRGIMRTAKIEHFQSKEVIQSKQTSVDRLYIILEGKLGVLKNQDYSDMISYVPKSDVFQELTGLAKRQTRRQSRISRRISSVTPEFQRTRINYDKKEEPQYILEYQRNSTFGDKARSEGQFHTHTTIAITDCLAIVVEMKNIFFWLNHCFIKKMETSFGLLRKHPCFSNISDELLEGIVEFLAVKNVRKGSNIYQQGSDPTHIYFLQEGQLKIQKTSHLFVENPNQLYVDRRTLMTERELNNHEYLEYADLHLLYNYRPTNKTVDLGILNPFCIFGEEQIIEGRQRSTSIKCESLRCIYFAIQLKKLYQHLGDASKYFLDAVKASMKEKVRYRQSAYAATINFENRSNLKCFYEGDSQSLKKDLINKINSRILKENQPKTYRSARSNLETEKNIMNKSSIETGRDESSVPASFNTFNFHKMLKTKLKRIPPGSDSSDDEELIKKQKTQDQIIREKKIVNNSHTWRLVKDKVQKQFKMGKKIGTLAHKVNFNSPLIDEKYFREIQTEIKRIQRQKKSGKTDFKVRSKSFVASRSRQR